MSKTLKNERILLITPRYFNYEIYIKDYLEKTGHQVYVIYENIDEISIKCKVAKRLGKYENYSNAYFKNQIGKKRFDTVLAIRASSLSAEVIEHIKINSPNAKLFLYQWDSVKNNPNAITIAPYFDKVSTFDLNDADKYGWNYRPLFYINASQRLGVRKYDIAYICSLHSKRVNILYELKKLKCNKYLYIYSKFSHFIKEKYLTKNEAFLNVSYEDVNFKPLSLDKVNTIMSESNIVVDYTHPNQTGFTMRTCEALGNRCKLATNNKLVVNADFYNENNVYVYDPDNFAIPDSFIKSPFLDLDKKIYERYSISCWLKDILDYE